MSAPTDETLLARIRQGDEEAERLLYNRYKQLVRSRAHSYFLIGADHEDLVQEGMIGLYKAVCEYDGSKAASFKSFAELCVTRQILSAIKQATRKKHGPLNNTVVAPPRMLIAFFENNLQADGTIRIPEVLRPYMGFKETIG